jgi:hypothetical protein
LANGQVDDLKLTREQMARNSGTGTAQMEVNFMRRGWEPPYPFGRSEQIIETPNHLEAIEIVKRSSVVVSPRCKISAPVLKQFRAKEGQYD